MTFPTASGLVASSHVDLREGNTMKTKTQRQAFLNMIAGHNRKTIIQRAIHRHFRVRHLAVDGVPVERLIDFAMPYFADRNLRNISSTEIATVVLFFWAR